MECRLAIVLYFAVGLIVCQVHVSSQEVQEGRMNKPYSEDIVGRTSADDLKKTTITEDRNSKPPIDQKAEGKSGNSEKEEKLKTSLEPSGAKLKIRFPDDATKIMQLKEDEESIRTKKSTSMRHDPHTTTVCIQVRSDHQPRVMCGPQVGDDKEQKPPGSARFAYQPPSHGYHDASQQPMYMRSSQPGPSQGRSMGMNIQQAVLPTNPLAPQKYMQPGPNAISPYSSGMMGPQGYSMMMRSEDAASNSIKPTEGPPPPSPPHGTTAGTPPIQIPSSVVLHKEYYRYPPLYPGLSTNPPSALRFNCALQPDGAQFIPTYPLIRSPIAEVPAGYYRVGEQLITLQDNTSPRMAQSSPDFNEQAYFLDGQARQAQSDQTVGSMYAPGYGYNAANQWENTYLGEDGQAYFMDENQARAATEDQLMKQQMWEQNQYLKSMSSSTSSGSSMAMRTMSTRNQEQEQELLQAKKRVAELQETLKNIQKQAAENEDAKKVTNTVHPPTDIPKETETPELVEAKPETPIDPASPEKAAAKRQTNRRGRQFNH